MQYIFNRESSSTVTASGVQKPDLKKKGPLVPAIPTANPALGQPNDIHQVDAMDMDDVSVNAQLSPKSPFYFIQSLEKAGVPVNAFVYLRPIPLPLKSGQPTFNPYHLESVSYSELDIKDPAGYYTLSARVRTFYLNSSSKPRSTNVL